MIWPKKKFDDGFASFWTTSTRVAYKRCGGVDRSAKVPFFSFQKFFVFKEREIKYRIKVGRARLAAPYSTTKPISVSACINILEARRRCLHSTAVDRTVSISVFQLLIFLHLLPDNYDADDDGASRSCVAYFRPCAQTEAGFILIINVFLNLLP